MAKQFWELESCRGCESLERENDRLPQKLADLKAIKRQPMADCTDCGACCFEQGGPPGYIVFLVDPPPHDDPDRVRWEQLPDDARRAIRIYREKLMAGKVRRRRPCCWLNLATNRCHWYEHRPQICRDFTPGSEACQAWRDKYNVDVEAG